MNPRVALGLRTVGRLGLAFEVAAFVVIVATGGLAGFLILPVLLIGQITSLIGALPKPRSGAAWLAFLLHLPFFLYFVVWDKGVEPWLKHRAYDQGNRHYWEQRRQREKLASLVEAGKLDEAKAFLREGVALRLATEPPWRTALCPPDGRPADLELLELMGERGAPRDGTLLVKAARCSLSSVQAVLKLGIEPTARSTQGYTGLMTASSLDVLEFFLAHGVKVDARSKAGATALMFHRTPEVTKFLLAHGADPKAVDDYGRSALHYKYQGAEQHLAACYELILAAGADPNLTSRNCNYTPLHALAADRQDENADRYWVQDAADVLVKRGADPLVRDCSGETPLSLLIGWEARVGGDLPITASLRWPNLKLAGVGGGHLLMAALRAQDYRKLKELLEAGANPLAGDFNGKVPIAYFEDHFHPQMPPHGDYKDLIEAAARFRPVADAGP
jgi:ankyrin repeat protein